MAWNSTIEINDNHINLCQYQPVVMTSLCSMCVLTVYWATPLCMFFSLYQTRLVRYIRTHMPQFETRNTGRLVSLYGRTWCPDTCSPLDLWDFVSCSTLRQVRYALSLWRHLIGMHGVMSHRAWTHNEYIGIRLRAIQPLNFYFIRPYIYILPIWIYFRSEVLSIFS